jgi:hypothetical protein
MSTDLVSQLEGTERVSLGVREDILEDVRRYLTGYVNVKILLFRDKN